MTVSYGSVDQVSRPKQSLRFEDDESAALLAPRSSVQSNLPTGSNVNNDEGDNRSTGDSLKTPLSFLERQAVLCISIVLIFFVSGPALQDAPLTQIYERIVCEKYYRLHDSNNSTDHPALPGGEPAHGDPCKINPIEAEVAWIQGIVKAMEFVPTIFLAVAFSRLSDRIGRRPILLLSMLGVSLQYVALFIICWFGYTLPLRLVFLAPLLTAIGGGATVSASVLYAFISDIVPVESLTRHYYSLIAVELITIAVCRTASSFLMEWSIWSALIIGNLCFFTACLLCLAMPETLHIALRNKPSTARPLSPRQNDEDSVEHLGLGARLVHSCKSGVALLVRNRPLVGFILLNFLFSFAERVSNFILLYTSKRYDLSFAKANYFNSYRTVINTIALLGILPLSSWILIQKLHVTPYYKAVATACSSCILFLSGCIVLGLGRDIPSAVTGITLFGLGIGGMSDLRILMLMYAPPGKLGLCHTLFNLLRDLGEAVSGPLYSFTFAKGLQLGGHWVGMPFQVSAVVFAIVAVLISIVWMRSGPATAVTAAATTVDDVDDRR